MQNLLQRMSLFRSQGHVCLQLFCSMFPLDFCHTLCVSFILAEIFLHYMNELLIGKHLVLQALVFTFHRIRQSSLVLTGYDSLCRRQHVHWSWIWKCWSSHSSSLSGDGGSLLVFWHSGIHVQCLSLSTQKLNSGKAWHQKAQSTSFVRCLQWHQIADLSSKRRRLYWRKHLKILTKL